MSLNRRTLLIGTALTASTAMLGDKTIAAGPDAKRKFTMDLRGSSVGIKADLKQAIQLASDNGFESVAPDAGYLAKLSGVQRADLLAQMKDKNLTWGSAGLPVDFRKDDATFRGGAGNLPKMAKALQQAGVTRVGTWLMPCHDELTYVANFRQHARRLRECATILKDHGQRFGLEYVGPKTLWASKRHSFVHSMRETKELIAEAGVDNMGFVLDSWHWFTAHENIDDILTLTNDDIVACDLNDAPKGLEIDQQIDSRRELPMTTGVIDLKAFLSALVQIGYDGPIRAEPFNGPLNQLGNEEAAAATAKAMKSAFDLVS
ncbi:sugar phosphate isomerase/epimerase family protein [Planctomycetes bacterium K23_9]|uniref:Inosose isomerase n=1 Tax=Stieleria marina TaxID=1930275 RepID=A0A517NYK9_9BACT|nr:Inosose isomerase [Planctomycetes bacterium K23_9]